MRTNPKDLIYDTFSLVDAIAQGGPMARGKARKAIRGGRVTVDGTVTKDPNARVDGNMKIEVRL